MDKGNEIRESIVDDNLFLFVTSLKHSVLFIKQSPEAPNCTLLLSIFAISNLEEVLISGDNLGGVSLISECFGSSDSRASFILLFLDPILSYSMAANLNHNFQLADSPA